MFLPDICPWSVVGPEHLSPVGSMSPIKLSPPFPSWMTWDVLIAPASTPAPAGLYAMTPLV